MARPREQSELLPPPGVVNPEVTYWWHRGVELPGNEISTWLSRRLVSANAPPPNTQLPVPGQPLEVSLGNGVSALLLVLDGVTDPHNLGACLRVADGAGAHAVIAPKDHAVGINATVAKVASGAAETVPAIELEP